MKPIIRDSAFADLQRIRTWIAKDSPAAATRVIDRILVSIDRLAVFPLMGHEGTVSGTLELIVSGLPYIVVYTVDEAQDELAVIAIFHGAQDR